VIVAAVVVFTPEVAMLKVAVLLPAATVTEVETVALVLLEFKLTAIPPVGAACDKVTVPVEDDPPATLLGETARAVTVAPVRVSLACC